MFRSKLLTVIASLSLVCSMQNRTCAQGKVNGLKPNEIVGVYEFVTRTADFTKPKKYTTDQLTSDWEGMWIFKDGYFSSVLMKKGREVSYDPRVLDHRDYESHAGTYKIEEKYITFTVKLASSPLEVGQTQYMEYRLEGDTLTLIQVVSSHAVDISKGTITTVLRRIG